ncbi:MAG: ferritin [Ilumatobacter coccineus]|uniref:Ferritin n=1 Tax=Ilumatobacter coccineus TaxID=467094 RepID=A0A2G6KC48_9ACTN|nr:MAG: ferritin [Ilumatobacter coccineus]
MISETIQEALLQQLNREFYSAHLYMAMSAHCASMDFDGSAHWFRLQYQEEEQHANRIFDYLVGQDAKITIYQVDTVPDEYGTLLDVFEASLKHEQHMTAELNKLSSLALEQTDHATYNMLQWFVSEQLEEEATLRSVIAKFRLVGNDGYGQLTVDASLGNRKAN